MTCIRFTGPSPTPTSKRDGQHWRNQELVERLRAIGQRYARTPGEVAIAWALHHPAVTAALVEIRRPGQVRGIIEAVDLRLSSEEFEELQNFSEKAAGSRA